MRNVISRFVNILIIACIFSIPNQPILTVKASTHHNPLFLFPIPNSTRLNPQTSIIIRYADSVNASALQASSIHVVGDKSGMHTGKVAAADDHATVTFYPKQPFQYGERITVAVSPDWISPNPGSFSFSFDIDKTPSTLKPTASPAPADSYAALPSPSSQSAITSAFPNYLTLPADYPSYTINQAAAPTNSGYYFMAPFDFGGNALSNHFLILDNNGEPVYTVVKSGFDFKVQPNGLLSYYDNAILGFVVMDSTYNVVANYFSVGYPTTDVHDFHILPGNHVNFMINDIKTMDLSAIGGNAQAQVSGAVIQELDSGGNVVFEWRSWDHFVLADTDDHISRTTATVDSVHSNAIELDWDGNYLLSSRHLDEITKINRTTGAIIWRLGGKNNQFRFTNVEYLTSLPFTFQHDIRRLPNGNITLFDNRNNLTPLYSAAEEYSMNEDTKTVTKNWEYQSSTPGVYSSAMGNAQRLSNGNTVIGWGLNSNFPNGKQPDITEVMADGSKVFEMTFSNNLLNYRAFRFNWHANPTWPPVIAFASQPGQVTVGTSWNGATEVDHYDLYSGSLYAGPAQLESSKPKTGFETQWTISADISNYCYFYAQAYDQNNNLLGVSGKTYNPSCLPYHFSLPWVAK